MSSVTAHPEPAGDTVLVIDDSDIAREEIMRILSDAGMRTVGLSSPIGATRMILKHSVTAVVLDVLMPSIRGDRLAALFRGNPRFSELAVVLVSGQGNDELSRLSSEAQADAVVSKGELQRLVQVVNDAIRARTGTG